MSEAHVTPVPREARPYQGRRAGVVTRMAAAVLDGVVVVALLAAGYGCWAGALFLVHPRTFSFPEASWIGWFTVGFLVAVVYLTVGWGFSGRSYGAHVMGLRVLGVRGRRLRPAVAFARAVTCVGWPVGLLWCAVSRSNRSVQDLLLRTEVVYDWRPRPTPD